MPQRRISRYRAAVTGLRSIRVLDMAWAVGLMLLLAYSIDDPPGPAYPGPGWVYMSVAALVALPVAARGRWPVTVLAVVLTAAAVTTAAGIAGSGVLLVQFLPAAVVLYTVGSLRTWAAAATLVVALIVAGASVAVFYAVQLPKLPPVSGAEVPLWAPGEIAAIATVLVGCCAVGAIVRWRRETAARLARSQAHAAVVDERLRIARDLHDIIGHSMSLISVKATVANHLADSRPDEVRAALAVIEETSRNALEDIRHALGVLRSAEPGELTPAELAPTAGPAQLAELAAGAQAAGVRVDLEVHGVGDLPEALGLVVYRVVQESLTNVIRHALPTTCRVAVAAAGEALQVEVTDDGPARQTTGGPGGGYGLLGMAERVALYGGTMTAGPRPEGGFAVAVRLPYQRAGRS